jgi:exopolysaccharide production protein ExoQ
MTQIAVVIFIIGICGLFLLDRDPKAGASKALWLPVAWLLISGSRPVSVWLHIVPSNSPDQYLDGSPLERVIYTTLLAIGLLALFARRTTVARFLWPNWPIVLFVSYCAVSILWSDYPDVAFKRWIKSLGDYVMVLIVLTDADRLWAVKRVFARVGFLLLPISVLLIKYYPDLGRAYARHWEGTVFYVGVAADKNMLGMTCLVFGLGSAWRFLHELRREKEVRNKGTVIAHGVIIVMALWLFWMSDSMTSLSCFVLGTGLMTATLFLKPGRKHAVVHVLVAAILCFCFCVLFLNLGDSLLRTMGRNPTLTGRTELWDRLLGMTPNPIVGAGFESFWLGSRLEKLWSDYWWHPNESHNGYLEIYLNLGWAGLVLLAGVVVSGYRNVIRMFNQDPEFGRLCIAIFVIGVAYNFTEAATRTMSLVWIAFLMALIVIPKTPVPSSVPRKAAYRPIPAREEVPVTFQAKRLSRIRAI